MMFNLPAPASVEWYRPGVAGGGQPDRIFNRLKAKLIGGKDDSGTGYFPMHDRKISSSDADKIIANMKQDEDGYPMLQTGSTSGEAEREYQEWIIDRYLVDTPNATQESEDIPVEVEIIEVEQKQPDEPIVIQIEAPFESTPEQKLRAPERLRLPGIKNTFKKKKSDKRTTAQRMAEGFNKNLLDPLIETIIAPPAPLPRKKRKKKQVQAQKKTSVKVSPKKDVNYDETGAADPNKATNFNEYVGRKIGSAFKSAALARKEFIDMGGSVEELKDRKFTESFFAKSLGFEFGGDKIARTKGMFSKTPDAFQDPALSRGQRYRSTISPLFSSKLPTKPSADPSEAGVTPEVIVEPIQASYSNILDGYMFGAQQFQTSVEVEKKGSDTVAQFDAVIKEIKDLIDEKNKNKKTKLALKQEKLRAEADAAQTEKDKLAEAQLEGSKDTANTRKTKFAASVTPAEQEEEDDPDAGGGNILGNILGFGLEYAGEELAERGLKKLFQRGGQKAVQQAGQQVAQQGARVGGMAAGTAAAIVGGVGLAASAAGEGLFQVAGKEGGIADKAIETQKEAAQARREAGDEVGATLLELSAKRDEIGSEVLKGTGVALDAIGAPFRYAIEAIRYPFLNEKDREKQAENLAKFDGRIREYTRSWMNRIDLLNIIPDEQGGFGNIYGNEEANKAMMKDMAGYKEKDIDLFRKAREQWIAKREKDGLSKPTPEEEKEFRLNWQKENEKDVSLNDKDTKEKEKLAEGGYNPPEFTPPPETGERTGGNLGGTTVVSTSGGVPAMVGEAGNEMVGTPKEIASMAKEALDKKESDPITESARIILGALDNVVGQTGLLGAAVRPAFEKQAAPLIKAFGIENFAFGSDVGKGQSELKNIGEGAETDSPGGGFFENILEFFGIGSGKSLPSALGPGGMPGALSIGGGGGRITANQAYSYLMSKGMSENHAKGIVANISRESGFKLGAHNPNDPGAGSFGLFQWNGGRAQRMMAAVPDYQTNWKGQIDYALGEDHGPRYLSTQFNSPGEAAYDWMKYWERPAAYVQAKYTSAVYDQLINNMGLSTTGTDSPGVTPPRIPSQQPVPTSSSGFSWMPQIQPQSPGVIPAAMPAMPMAPLSPSASTPSLFAQPQGITPSMIIPIIQPPTVAGTTPPPAPALPNQPSPTFDWNKQLQQAILERQ